jgi:hypothetical protein
VLSKENQFCKKIDTFSFKGMKAQNNTTI